MKYFVVVLCLLYSSVVMARDIRITGYVVDGMTGAPITDVACVIYDNNNNVLFSAMINSSNGAFEFQEVSLPDCKCTAIFSMGFELMKRLDILVDNHIDTLDLGEVQLEQYTHEIEASLVRPKQYVRNEVGKEIYYIDSTYYSNVINAGDLLRKIPLLNVDSMNKSVNIIGKSNVLVTVNGINNGNEVDLRRLNYNDIERVEIITLPSSGVDGNFDGMINIELKQSSTYGYEVGLDEMFRFPSKDNDLYAGVSYGSEKMKFEFLYSNYFRSPQYFKESTRENTSDRLKYVVTGYTNNGKEMDNTFNVNFDWHITPKDYLNLTTQTDISTLKEEGSYNRLIENCVQGTHTELTPYLQTTSYRYLIGNYTLHYRHDFENKLNWISVTCNTGFTRGYNYTGMTSSDDYNIGTKESINRASGNFIVDYKNKQFDNCDLDAGAQFFYRNVANHINNSQIQHNRYKNYRYNIYADFAWDNGAVGIKLGLKFEGNTNAFLDTVNYYDTNFSFQPSVGLSYRPNGKNTLEITYKRIVNYPTIWQLMPYAIVSDDKTQQVGSMELQPYAQNRFGINYSFKNDFIKIRTGPEYLHMRNILIPYQKLDEAFNAIHTYVNDGNIHRMAYVFSTSITPIKWLSISGGYIGFYDNFTTFKQKRTDFHHSLSLSCNITFPYQISLYSEGNYSSKSLTTTGYNEANYSISAVNIRKYFPQIGMGITLSYWQPLTSPQVSHKYFGEYHISEYTKRVNLSAIMLRIEWYIMSKKQLSRNIIKTYFDTDARLR